MKKVIFKVRPECPGGSGQALARGRTFHAEAAAGANFLKQQPAGGGFAVGRRLGWLRLSEIRDTEVRDEARGRTGLDQGGPGEEDGFKPQDGF